jgi:tetratricopeptide (TPR) repeat protein
VQVKTGHGSSGVEQRTHKPLVGGSNPPRAIHRIKSTFSQGQIAVKIAAVGFLAKAASDLGRGSRFRSGTQWQQLTSIGLAGLMMSWCSLAWAHIDPTHNIAILTEEIEKGDTRPAVYYARSTDYRVLGKLDEALADLKTALSKDPTFLPAQRDLSQVLSLKGLKAEADQAAQQALKLAAKLPPANQAMCLVDLARLDYEGDRHEAAIKGVNVALELIPQGRLDWYILRSRAQIKLKRYQEAATGLEQGVKALRSIVLRSYWIESLILADRATEALPMIEQEMSECRYKAQWLIRRARALMALKEKDRAQDDLRLALGELDLRVDSTTTPDPMLLVDRGMAHALMEQKEAALKDLASARANGAEADMTEPLSALVEPPPVHPPDPTQGGPAGSPGSPSAPAPAPSPSSPATSVNSPSESAR